MKKILVLIFALFALSVSAETYKVYLGTPPGALSDVYTRKLFDLVHQDTGDVFIILNRPGADQLVAYKEFLEESKVNNNVIYSSGTSSLVASYLNHAELKLDPLQDTKSLFLIMPVEYYLIARQDSSINSINDIRGKINVGSSNSTNATLMRLSNFENSVINIPFKGDNDIILSLLQKEIDIANIISINPLLKIYKDKIKIISKFENIKIVGAVGYTVAKDFPDDRTLKLNHALNTAIHRAEIQQWFYDTFSEYPAGGPPSKYDTIILNFKRILFSKSQ